MALRLPAEKREQAVIPHIEEIVTHRFIGWVAAIAGAGAETGRNLHRMDERHAEHIDIEIDGRLHVVRAERQVVDAAHDRRGKRRGRFGLHVLDLFSGDS